MALSEGIVRTMPVSLDEKTQTSAAHAMWRIEEEFGYPPVGLKKILDYLYP